MKYIGGILLFLFSVSACTFNADQVFIKENIDENTKLDIYNLNSRALHLLKDSNTIALWDMFSPQLRANLKDINSPILESFSTEINSIENINNYTVLDEFLVKSKASKIVVIPSELTSTKDYSFTFQCLKDEAYVSLLRFGYRRNFDLMVTIVYGKYDNEWKINILHISDYSFNHHTAPYYYELATSEYSMGNIINAFIKYNLANHLSKPSGDSFKYNIENGLTTLSTDLEKTIAKKYHFPIVLEELKNKPQIIALLSQEIEDTFAPLIYYETNISISDTVQLKQEYEEIRKIMPFYFKGILNNDYVCYRAFKKGDIDDENRISYGFVDERRK